MTALKTGISLYRVAQLVDGDTRRTLDIVRQADLAGVDIVSAPDHVVFASDARDTYPLGPENFPGGLDEPWYEPLTFLSVVAGMTERIRLSTNILISPIRSGVLLAKTLATLDALSGGRVETVFGAGWQRQEFEACGMPFEGRFSHMEEQIAVCRLLWRQAPASYSGKFITFKDIWSFPRPVQATVPIWLGVKPSERNCARMGRLADGWLPDNMDPDFIRTNLANIRGEMERAGRDPRSFGVRAGLMPVIGAGGTIDFAATFAQAGPLIEAGVTQIDAATMIVIQHENQVAEVIGRLAELKRQFS